MRWKDLYWLVSGITFGLIASILTYKKGINNCLSLTDYPANLTCHNFFNPIVTEWNIIIFSIVIGIIIGWIVGKIKK